MTFILPSFGASAISAVPGGGGGGGASGWNNNSHALEFDGTDDYVSLGNSSDLAPSNITLSLWFKASGSVSSYNYLLFREGGLYGSYSLRYRNNNKFSWFLGVTGNTHLDGESSSTFTLTDWHHVALTYDQTNIKLYVDGIEEYSAAETRAIDYTPNSSYGTDNTTIGAAPFSDPAEGLIDEVAIFNTALSASQITNIYRGEDDGGSGGTNGVPGDLSTFNSNNGPVGWWRMGDNDSGTGTTITDQGSGGNDGTIENGSSGNTSPTYSTDVPVAPLSNTYSVEFDGSNDHMSLTSTVSGAGAYTLSFWIRPLGGNEGWVLYGTSGEYISYYGAIYGNKLLVRNMGSITTATDSIMVNNWYHVFLVRDSSNNVELFINGSSAGTSTFSGTLAFNKILNPSYGLYGHFDEVAFFNSDQSANLSSIYNSGVPDDLSSYSPTHWWRMGDNETGVSDGSATPTTITDQGVTYDPSANGGSGGYVASGNDGTLTNGPTYSTDTP